MEMEIVRQDQPLTQQSALSKACTIVQLMARLSVRRQAQLTDQDYTVLARDLEAFNLRDVEAGLQALGESPRRDGETAFPELGRLLGAVRAAQSARLDRSRGKIGPCKRCDSMRMVVVADPKTGKTCAHDCECLMAWKQHRADRGA